MSMLTCGCPEVEFQTTVNVHWGESHCDAVTGFSPALAYGVFCHACVDKWRADGALIETPQQWEAFVADFDKPRA